jgi:hypothetical protein
LPHSICDGAQELALCTEYRKVIELLDGFEAQVKQLRERHAWLEEELLTRIEGYEPQ